MWQLMFWSCVFVAATLLAPVQRVSACSCALSHPQSQFCDSAFVAVVRVKKAFQADNYQTAYKVKVHKIFKLNAKNNKTLDMLWTPSSESMCGVTLNVGDTYVVSGGIISDKARISICSLALRWVNIPSKQKKAFRQLYQHGCDCNIGYTRFERKGKAFENAEGKKCIWESRPGPEYCQEKYGVCIKQHGRCSWMPSMAYNKCIKTHQRLREHQKPYYEQF